MKKIIIYGFLIVVSVFGAYLGLRLKLGIFTPYNIWTAKQDIKDGNVQLIILGLPAELPIKQKLAEKYGFRFSFFCVPSTELENGTTYYNRVVREYLTKKYGENFWTKFDKEVEQAIAEKRIEEVTSLVAKQKNVKNQINLVESVSGGKRHISFLVNAEESVGHMYLVKVAENNGANFVTYFNFLVDASKMKIINEDGKLDGQY